MLYTINTFGISDFQLTLAVTVSLLFLAITIVKENRDERKRA